jgi:hypothetical protein
MYLKRTIKMYKLANAFETSGIGRRQTYIAQANIEKAWRLAKIKQFQFAFP